MILSILIPTVIGRNNEFNKLVNELRRQINVANAQEVVEIKWISDNKELTVGEKREKLYLEASGEYSWQIDDDDTIHFKSIEFILEALKSKITNAINIFIPEVAVTDIEVVSDTDYNTLNITISYFLKISNTPDQITVQFT